MTGEQWDGQQWEGRDVELREFDIVAGEAVVAASKAGGRDAYYLTLVLSAHYVDTGEPVFASLEELRRHPFRLLRRIQHLASLAVLKNSMEGVDDNLPLDAARGDVPSSPRAGNGADG